MLAKDLRLPQAQSNLRLSPPVFLCFVVLMRAGLDLPYIDAAALKGKRGDETTCLLQTDASVSNRHTKMTSRFQTDKPKRHVCFKPTSQNKTPFSKRHSKPTRGFQNDMSYFCLLHSGPFLNV